MKKMILMMTMLGSFSVFSADGYSIKRVTHYHEDAAMCLNALGSPTSCSDCGMSHLGEGHPISACSYSSATEAASSPVGPAKALKPIKLQQSGNRNLNFGQ